MDGAALTLVDCKPMSARLTEAACARRWRTAQEKAPSSWDSLRHCHTCPIGAIRAGASVSTATNAAIVAAFNHICPRCERPAARLIHGRTCVSCYNRTAEAVRGVNAKGTRPRLADLIHPERLAIGGRILTVDRVATRVEAVAIVARQAGPGAIIGVPALQAPAPGWQLPLCLPMPMGSIEHDMAHMPAAPPEPLPAIPRVLRARAPRIPLIRMIRAAAAAA